MWLRKCILKWNYAAVSDTCACRSMQLEVSASREATPALAIFDVLSPSPWIREYLLLSTERHGRAADVTFGCLLTIASGAMITLVPVSSISWWSVFHVVIRQVARCQRSLFASKVQICFAHVAKLGMTESIRHAPSCLRRLSHCPIRMPFLWLLPSSNLQLIWLPSVSTVLISYERNRLRIFDINVLIFNVTIHIVISFSLHFPFYFYIY